MKPKSFAQIRDMLQIISPLLLMTACAAPDAGEYAAPAFEHEHTIEIHPITHDLLIDWPRYTVQCDSMMVLNCRNVDNDNLFHAISLADGSIATSFVYIGRGPDELMGCYCLTADADNGIMYAMDSNQKILGIDLRQALSGDKQFVAERYDFPDARSAKSAHYVGGRLLCEGTPRYFIGEMTGGRIDKPAVTYDEYPPMSGFSDDEQLRDYFYYNSESAAAPDGKRFFNVTRNGMLLEIFSLTDEGIRSDKLRRFYPTRMKKVNTGTDDCIFGACEAQATDSRIYVLYIDSTCGEYDYNTTCPKIAVFDWSGNEVAQYSFSDRVVRFVVTPDDKRVYCWALIEDEDGYLGYFDLIEN
ncbi:MAG: TolB-like 6-bladed beta-propeller domain-containing protein [Ruminococcus flavefaciens]|nr:TolB-like 6-bladed beta-propeller domain-containing protein [Ruminococcus flavefaciens]